MKSWQPEEGSVMGKAPLWSLPKSQDAVGSIHTSSVVPFSCLQWHCYFCLYKIWERGDFTFEYQLRAKCFRTRTVFKKQYHAKKHHTTMTSNGIWKRSSLGIQSLWLTLIKISAERAWKNQPNEWDLEEREGRERGRILTWIKETLIKGFMMTITIKIASSSPCFCCWTKYFVSQCQAEPVPSHLKGSEMLGPCRK